MRHGEDEEFLEEIWRDGEDVEAIENRPELWPWNGTLWRAWCHLSSSRRGGFSALPVPVSEVLAYVELRHPDFTVDERMEFLEIVSRLDGVWFKTTEDLKPEKKEGGSQEE